MRKVSLCRSATILVLDVGIHFERNADAQIFGYQLLK